MLHGSVAFVFDLQHRHLRRGHVIQPFQTRRFHGHDALHQLGSRLRRHPGENGSVAVCQQDRRSDIVQQDLAARAPEFLRDRVVAHRLAHRRHKLHHRRIVGIVRARPLAARHAFRHAFEHRRFAIEQPVHKRFVRIAALAGTVDHVDLIALFEKQRSPSAAAVGRADPFRSLPVSAVNQHYGVRMADLRGNPVLDIHLPAVAHGAAREQSVLDAIPVVTPLGDVEDRACIVGRHLGLKLRRQRTERACRKHAESAPGQSGIRIVGLHRVILHPQRSYYVRAHKGRTSKPCATIRA